MKEAKMLIIGILLGIVIMLTMGSGIVRLHEYVLVRTTEGKAMIVNLRSGKASYVTMISPSQPANLVELSEDWKE